ncbi:MAG: tyrosine-protein phosphatase [Phycisphaerae bacterium]
MLSSPPKIRRRKRFGFALGATAVALAVGVPLWLYYFTTPRRFAAVEPGLLYRSAQPNKHQIDHLIGRIGLRSILIVRSGVSKRVPDEAAYARERGLEVWRIPVESRKPIPDSQVEAFFRFVDDPTHQPVLIHCSAGRHRTGYLCGLYRIERQGWTVEQAVAEMLAFDPDMGDDRPELRQLRAHRPGRWSRRPMSGTAPAERKGKQAS